MNGIKKVTTGVDGLDALLKGGIPEKNVVLLGGGPGTGKTTFGVQYLVHGAMKENQPGLLVTTHSEKTDLFNMYAQYGWDLEKLNKEKKLLIKEIDTANLEDYFARLLKELYTELKANNVKRFCFDSVSAIHTFFRDSYSLNHALMQLVTILKDAGCTSLLTYESGKDDVEDFRMRGTNTVCDGIIMLYNMRILNTRNRVLEVVKMRATDHDKDLRPFAMTQKGITVFPQQVVFSGKE